MSIYFSNDIPLIDDLVNRRRTDPRGGKGVIIGLPGSGKSTIAGQQIASILRNSEDEVIVIDTAGAYQEVADCMGGHVIRLAPRRGVYINPFDIATSKNLAYNPTAGKAAFITTLCDAMVGDTHGLTPSQRSIIDRVVHRIYEPFLESYIPQTGEYDHSLIPTLTDFHNILRNQAGYDAHCLAVALDLFVHGSLDSFSKATNAEHSSRLTVFDIQTLSCVMNGIDMMVVLEHIWTHICANHQPGKHTWLFIDDCSPLLQRSDFKEYFMHLFARSGLYGCIPTGVTQMIPSLLNTDDHPISLICHSSYVHMLSLSNLDSKALSEQLGIPSDLISFVAHAEPGKSLIYHGPTIIAAPANFKDQTAYYFDTSKRTFIHEDELVDALQQV